MISHFVLILQADRSYDSVRVELARADMEHSLDRTLRTIMNLIIIKKRLTDGSI
jgi:hypothetical protein